ncbi:MAG: OmpA family protein [Saprospiraceae bacterium]|nr:OmpA family protein [Saprospiraceae bacterium]
MVNILDTIYKHLAPQNIAEIARQVGESEGATAKAISGLAATFLAGLLQKAGDTEGITRIFHELEQFPTDIDSKLDDLLKTGKLPHHGPSDASGHLLSQLFGAKVPTVINGVAAFSGVQASSISTLLGIAGPYVMSLLAQRINSGALNVSGFINLLRADESRILSSVPSGLGAVLGFHPETAASEAPAPQTTGSRWAISLLLLLGLGIALLFGIRYWMIANTELNLRPVGEALNSTMQATKEITGALKDASEIVAGFMKTLPGGKEVKGNKEGIESQLIAFIEDTNRPVDKTTWFNFDRLLFATNSTEIEMDRSAAQLSNMVDILKAYPTVQLRIGGYTDNTGVESLNRKLSLGRANAVVKYLVAQGIEASRLSAEGYGSEHPVASNETEEGRAQNRRIAVRVTKK